MTWGAWLRSLLPAWARALIGHLRTGELLSPDARASFAQEGEDLLLARLFEDQARGFYVDVGAHHPTRFSNTHLLHKRGWRGINIDATPGSMAAFRRARPDDINLEIAVSSEGGPSALYRFDEAALNSLSKGLSIQRNEETRYSIESTVELATRPLRDVLSQYLPHDVERIDLLTIDVEGHDLDVLKSNDWERFRPRVLLIEIVGADLEELADREEVVLLRRSGYRLYSKMVYTVAFVDGRTAGDHPPVRPDPA